MDDLLSRCLTYSEKAYNDDNHEGELLRVGSSEVWIYSDDKYTFVAFRGTEPKGSDILTDLRTLPRKIRGGWCHAGFKSSVDSLAPYIRKHIVNCIRKGQQVILTGHSMGGSMAELFGYLYPLPCSVVAVAPAQCLRVRKYPLPLTYLVNESDPVTRISFLNLYRHYGNLVQFGEPKGKIYGLLTGLFGLRSIISDLKYHPVKSYIEKYNEIKDNIAKHYDGDNILGVHDQPCTRAQACSPIRDIQSLYNDRLRT